MRYLLTVAYEGKDFFGFQSQVNGQTIQDELEKALKVFFRKNIRILGASRTDTGVHAEGQWVVFDVDAPFDTFKWLEGLNALTHPSIGVLSIQPVDEAWVPLQISCAKLYVYRLWIGPCYHPHFQKRVWSVRQIHLEKFLDALNVYPGFHNFQSYCDADTKAHHFYRLLYEVKMIQKGPLVEVWFLGQGFLKHMIRYLVGTAVAFGQERRKDYDEIWKRKGVVTAPSQGLTLQRIFSVVPPNIDALLVSL